MSKTVKIIDKISVQNLKLIYYYTWEFVDYLITKSWLGMLLSNFVLLIPEGQAKAHIFSKPNLNHTAGCLHLDNNILFEAQARLWSYVEILDLRKNLLLTVRFWEI